MSTSEPFPSGQNDLQDSEMANNNIDLITFDSINDCKESELDKEEKLECQLESCIYRLPKDLKMKEEAYTPQPECCIYKVPKELRKMKEEAYTPQVISIGPLHFGEKELADMEKQKIIFVREFCKRINEETWKEFINFIEKNEKRIRNCYAEMPNNKFKNLNKFIKMILYDAVFIIEYLLRHPVIRTDFLMSSLQRVKFSIWKDFLILENQLPYFVLKELYMLASSNQGEMQFLGRSSMLICYDLLNGVPEEEICEHINDLRDVEVKHFTDLRRYFITKMHHAKPKLPLGEYYGIDLRLGEYDGIDLPCAVKLQKSGVKFKAFKEKGCFLDIKVQKKRLLRIPWLDFPELQISHIGIYDETECLFRNLMAFERCHYPNETHVCNFINLMDRLINTEEDVNLLVEEGIISNCVGETARIANMFNQLCRNIELSESCYYETEEFLQKYYKNRWNHAKATLKRVYFNNPWRGTATVAAGVLLVLTLIQTIFSVK